MKPLVLITSLSAHDVLFLRMSVSLNKETCHKRQARVTGNLNTDMKDGGGPFSNNDLKQNEAESACADSTNKGVN